jgi:hypothetical protein
LHALIGVALLAPTLPEPRSLIQDQTTPFRQHHHPRLHDITHQPHHSHSFPQLAAPHSFKQAINHSCTPAVAQSLPADRSSHTFLRKFMRHRPSRLPRAFPRTSLDSGLALHCSLSTAPPQLPTVNVALSPAQLCTFVTPYHLCPHLKAGPAGQHRANAFPN